MRKALLAAGVLIFGLSVTARGEEVPRFTAAEAGAGEAAVAPQSEVLPDQKTDNAAAAAATQPAALAALIAEARSKNGNLNASREDKNLKLAQSHYERKGYFPLLGQSNRYNTQPDFQNHGQSERDYSYSYGAVMEQMLFDFGETRGKVRQLYHESRSAEQEAALDESDLAYQVAEAYWRLAMFQKLVALHQTSVASQTKNVASIADRVKANNAFAADQKQAESRLAQAEKDLLHVENGMKLAKQRLLYLVGRDTEGEIAIADELAFAQPAAVPPLEVEAHPDMKRIRAAQDAAAAARSAAKALLFPRFYMRATYDYQRQEEGSGASNLGPDGYYYTVYFNVKMPIGHDWVAGRGKVLEAEAKQRQLEGQAAAMSEDIKLRVAEARYQLDEAVKGVEAARKQCDAAKAALEVKANMRKANEVTEGDYALAEDDCARAEVGLYRAIYDLKCAEAGVTHAFGRTPGN